MKNSASDKKPTMDVASWQTASSDVKQSILERADPPTVRNFCQGDRRSREICRERLPAVVKYRSCLDSAKSARECDRIPMFSRQQFLNVIPPQISIIPDNELQLHHEFYSQNYKLKTEGFSQALYKAKIINTLCALIRPKIVIEHMDEMGDLPPYVDASLVDSVLSAYNRIVYDYKQGLIESLLKVELTGRNPSFEKGTFEISYWPSISKDRPSEFQVASRDLSIEDMRRLVVTEDPFILAKVKPGIYGPDRPHDHIYWPGIVYEPISEITANVFLISRIIYDLLNKGFVDWTLSYMTFKRGIGESAFNIQI